MPITNAKIPDGYKCFKCGIDITDDNGVMFNWPHPLQTSKPSCLCKVCKDEYIVKRDILNNEYFPD